MTIETPFPGRAATPWLNSFEERPRYFPGRGHHYGSGGWWNPGMGAVDLSQVTSDITDVYRVIQQGEPGMYTVQNADGSYTTYRQPIGNVSNLPVGSIQGNLQTGVQGTLTSGAGVWILLGVGVVLLLVLRKR